MKNTILCLGIAALAMLSGCASSMISPNTPGYDTQGCVEDALRKSSDKGLVVEAAAQFRRACAGDDWAACSALGVVSESGAAGARDDREAARLYARGCDGGNARSCVNLGKLLERVAPVEQGTRIWQLYATACDQGEAYGCAALGRALARSGPASRERAVELLDAACDAGRSEACFDLAEIERRSAKPWAVALAHYAKSCVAGNALACERMNPDATVAVR